MSPKGRTLLSLAFACICLSKSLLIRIKNLTEPIPRVVLEMLESAPQC